MTWRKASLVLIVCVVFDLFRAFFGMFWLFGPAVAGMYCSNTVNSALGTSVGGVVGTSVAGLCTGAAVAAGVAFGAGIQMFGFIMAMAIGLLGWLTVGGLLIFSNPRIFKATGSSLLMMLLGLGVSQVPFLGSLPALTATIGRLYHAQITREKKALQEWHQEQALLYQREQYQQYLAVLQAEEDFPEDTRVVA